MFSYPVTAALCDQTNMSVSIWGDWVTGGYCSQVMWEGVGDGGGCAQSDDKLGTLQAVNPKSTVS